MYFCSGTPTVDPYLLDQDRPVSKIERTARALLCAAMDAERCARWLTAAEFYEAAAELYSRTSNDDLLNAAVRCRRNASRASLPAGPRGNQELA